jgi:hypothetical protein
MMNTMTAENETYAQTIERLFPATPKTVFNNPAQTPNADAVKIISDTMTEFMFNTIAAARAFIADLDVDGITLTRDGDFGETYVLVMTKA